MTTYTRQSDFENGDVIDANLFNNEFDALATAMDKTTGHKHNGTEGTVVSILTEDTLKTRVVIDDTLPLDHKVNFYLADSLVLQWSQSEPLNLMQTTKITHEGGPLDDYLDALEVSVGDAATDAAAAQVSALQAINAAAVVGVPVLVADGGSYTIDDDAEVADVIFEGDGTLVFPSAIVKGRRFFVHLMLKATGKTVSIPATASYTLKGDIGTVGPSDTLVLSPGESLVFEVVSTTEMEIL